MEHLGHMLSDIEGTVVIVVIVVVVVCVDSVIVVGVDSIVIVGIGSVVVVATAGVLSKLLVQNLNPVPCTQGPEVLPLERRVAELRTWRDMVGKARTPKELEVAT